MEVYLHELYEHTRCLNLDSKWYEKTVSKFIYAFISIHNGSWPLSCPFGMW